MKRSAWVLLLSGFLATVGLFACVDHPQGEAFYIVAGIEPDDPPECEISASNDEFRAGGVWDVALSNFYLFSPRLENDLVPVGNEGTLQAEANHIQLTGFSIAVTTPGGISGIASTETPMSGLITAGGGTLTIAGMIILGPDAAESLRSFIGADPTIAFYIIAEITPRGETLGGREVIGLPFSFPVYVCYGCTIYGCVDGTCASTVEEAESPCVPGQDSSIDCQLTGCL